MDAYKFVGRVGGLAVALGVGTGLMTGCAAAWADDGSADASGTASSHPRGQAHSGARHARETDTGAAVGPTRSPGRAATTGPGAGREPGAPAASLRATKAPAPAATTPGGSPSPAPDPAPPLLTRPTASKVSAGTAITVDPQIGWNEGVLEGALNAESSKGLPLSYSVVDKPDLGGKVDMAARPGLEGQFSYLPYMTALANPAQTEKFGILVAEKTPFDEAVKKIPVIGDLADPLIKALHQTRLLSVLLAPLIGSAMVVPIETSPSSLAAGRPTAFTYKMPSFDGTLISLNYYPSIDVASGAVKSAPIVFNGPDLGFPGNTDIYAQWAPSLVNIVPGLTPLRQGASPFADGYVAQHGFNVITWDPRGEWASGGVMQLDAPFFEARDVSSIITWSTSADNVAASQVATTKGDPLVGMVGGSYGGGIQFTTAATDPRVDAIVPAIAWNTLNESLYPNDVFKTVIGSELLQALISTGARVNSTVYPAILTGALFSWLSQDAQAVLTNAGVGILAKNINIPTMFVQGSPDILFELDAAKVNAQLINGAHPQVPIRTTWFCGGHGVCLLPDSLQAPQGQQIMSSTLQWLDQYVAGSDTAIDAIPAFQWYDQKGSYHSSLLSPYDPAFNAGVPLIYRGPGGTLPLIPLIGGSGPSEAAVPPAKPTVFSTAFALASGSKARNAINLAVTPPVGTNVAGAPLLRFTYSGRGTSRAVYAQLVDNATGQVVGNIVTPVPVTLDGKEHTAQIRLADLAYNVANAGDSMTLQITSSALPYLNLTAWGRISISDVVLDIPVVA